MLNKSLAAQQLLDRRRVFLMSLAAGGLFNAQNAWGRWPWSALTWAQVEEMIEKDFPAVPSISTERLASWLAEGQLPLIIDVRDSKEFAVSHLVGAKQADSLAKIKTIIEQNPNAKSIVLYCSVAYRSAQWVQQLRKQGFDNTYNLKGSLFAWANEGRPVFKGSNRVDKVHPYDKRWGELLKPELRASV